MKHLFSFVNIIFLICFHIFLISLFLLIKTDYTFASKYSDTCTFLEYFHFSVTILFHILEPIFKFLNSKDKTWFICRNYIIPFSLSCLFSMDNLLSFRRNFIFSNNRFSLWKLFLYLEIFEQMLIWFKIFIALNINFLFLWSTYESILFFDLI